MPKQDGTGPDGNGPATGRGLGNCKPTQGNQPNQQPCGQGRGLKPCGGGRGNCGQGGQGRGRNAYPVGKP